MDEMRKVVPIIIAHYILGIIGCLIYSFIQPIPVDLVSSFVNGYRLRSGFILFVTFMPALHISGLLVGYAIAFSKTPSGDVNRWSAVLLKYLKGAFILCMVCITLYFVMRETVSPLSKARQTAAAARTEDYHDYVHMAQVALAADSPKDAEFAADAALKIWPGSPEANKLLEKSRYRIAELAGTSGVKTNKAEGANSDADLPPDVMTRNESGLTVLKAIDYSRTAEKKHDFFIAHYYAMLAWRLAKDTDPNKTVALRLAAEAWNHISSGSDSLASEGDADLYRLKRQGYDAIQNGDYLKAYYQFLDLKAKLETSIKKQKDPDVDRFLEVAKKGVLGSFFFIDETANLRLFEASRDIFFIIRRSDGGSDAVFVRGVTYTRSSGTDVAYLRDLEYVRFDPSNKLLYRISVPNAKMFPFDSDGKGSRPELLLRAVDRKKAGNDIVPAVLEGRVPESEKNILLLDMPYQDFNLIVAANAGPSGMTLMDLMGFSKTAAKYGFSQTAYLREITGRLAEPFLMLIISIFALILGWRYRLAPNVLFKAWWILVVPLFPIISMYLIETVRYLARMAIIAIVALVPQYCLLLTFAFLSVCFALVSLSFFSQRSE